MIGDFVHFHTLMRKKNDTHKRKMDLIVDIFFLSTADSEVME